jgi:hypothetical protein
MKITVDVAARTLMLDDEQLPMASASGNIITVNSSSSLGHKVWIFLNQMTGGVLVTVFNDKGQIAWEFEAVCKPETMVVDPKDPPGALADALRE